MNNLNVGFSRVNANPPLGINIAGYFKKRTAKGFLDDLEIQTIALECNDKKIIISAVDIIHLSVDFCNSVMENIESATGVSKDNVFLVATHTHTGPLTHTDRLYGGDAQKVETYMSFLSARITDAALMALDDLKPAKMGYIVGYAPERVAYIRRYKMKDGSTMTCPPIDDPNIDHAIGGLDQRVNVIRFDREDAETIVLMNYGVHADTIGGEYISSDWPGVMRRTFESAVDNTRCVFITGCEGDVGSTNVHPRGGDMNDTEISFDNEMKSPGMARFVGRALAGTLLQVYDKACYIDVDNIDILRKTVKIPSNMPRPEDLPLAHKYKALHDAGRDDEIPYEAMELTTVVAEANRMCALENGPEFFDLTLTGIKIGCVDFIGIPGEPFTDIGVGIKDTQGWSMILPCALANGSMGYFPMKSAYDEGGYEARNSRFKAGAAEIIIEESKKLLDELNK